METIGLTGGIGSGKSTIARIFKSMGFPVYIADTEASRLMNTSSAIIHDIKTRFKGYPVYSEEGYINKTVLAKLIFEDKDALASINHIVHPRVMEDFLSWGERQKCDYVFFESAILFEACLDSYFNHIICVTAPEAVRISRVITRDSTTTEKIRDRIRNQMDEDEKCRKSEFVIHNDNIRPVLPQIISIIEQLTIK